MADLATVGTLLGQGAIAGTVALGAFRATREGMVLARIGWAAERLHHKGGWRAVLAKPLAGCPRCMTSLWGTAAMLATGTLPEAWWQLPVAWAIGTGIQELADP